MLKLNNERSIVQPALGAYLASIRKDRRLTLRQVEEITGREVSNAYLSQIENGNVQQPSPNVLHALSEAYAIDYEQLMEMAGHIVPSRKRSADQRHGRIATFAEHNLTLEEEAALMDYLEFIRRKKRPNDQT